MKAWKDLFMKGFFTLSFTGKHRYEIKLFRMQ